MIAHVSSERLIESRRSSHVRNQSRKVSSSGKSGNIRVQKSLCSANVMPPERPPVGEVKLGGSDVPHASPDGRIDG